MGLLHGLGRVLRCRRHVALDLLLLDHGLLHLLRLRALLLDDGGALLLHLGELPLHVEQLLLHLGHRLAQRLVLDLELLDRGGVGRSRIGRQGFIAGDGGEQHAGRDERVADRAKGGSIHGGGSAEEEEVQRAAAAAACWHCGWLPYAAGLPGS